ncbi:MAG: tyrosine-type recombinase/integrase [Deltaproteobacteria bacterium]|nr:tyrosine-type recombinase/integrase [Deltaproteobacteria bacterium]
MKTNEFASCLAKSMTQFVELKCCSGITRDRLVKKLSYFDRFLSNNHFQSQRMDASTVSLYLEQQARVSVGTRYNRFCAVRQFCSYLMDTDPRSYVPDSIPSGRDGDVRQAYIYSSGEISSLLDAAAYLSPERPLRSETYTTLIGLLCATGMRISEALWLNTEDFHQDTGLLYIREGKFRKSRWIPLLPSARRALKRYMDLRSLSPPDDPEAPLLINLWGKRLNYSTVYGTFRQLLVQARLHSGKGLGPRIHDFRHTFAVSCLLKWYQDGEDVNARLPWLATYMGHVDIANTMVYLHATAELLEEVGNRFEAHYQITIKQFND